MPAPHNTLLDLIASYAASPLMSFDDKSQALFEFVDDLSDVDLRSLLAQAGFIPEGYAHDSSEEKVYAKAMDILVAVSLKRVGYDSRVGVERSNAADVEAKCRTGDQHTIVLDAKAFRLSRTALNPKDYKIEALNSWRRGSDYAALVGPIAGFPEGRSRLFEEAVKFNVTLLTFSHLQFMLEHGLPSGDALTPLWTVSREVYKEVGDKPTATQYWLHTDRIFCNALEVDIARWKSARREYFSSMLEVADKQIQYFQEEKTRTSALSREALIQLALEALKLDNKISVIEAKKRKTRALLNAVEKAES